MREKICSETIIQLGSLKYSQMIPDAVYETQIIQSTLIAFNNYLIINGATNTPFSEYFLSKR